MVIEAWPLFSLIPWKHSLASAELIKFAYQIQGVLYGSGAGIRAEIPAFVPFHSAGKLKSGIVLIYGGPDIRISLVIL